MTIRSTRFRQMYRILLITIGLVGVAINTELKPAMLLYYTTLSNVLCILYFIGLLILHNQVRSPNIKGAVTLAITVTMLIYWGILAPHSFNIHGVWQLTGTLLVHLVVPSMVILDWFLFDQKGRFSIKAPLYWLGIPLIYYAFTVIAANFKIIYPLTGDHYPYYFINSELIGWHAVFCFVAALLIFFLVFGYLLYYIDKRLAK
ncbi:Pr6Pr family membrane protein [Fructobacillus fructosus]|uniref:Pr6Pr family membrane protein n=1 Tax=Fructobacillus fructosus TaxID=1631 RepID=UPI00200A994E|nr:Pr6Pr family membrane protein [Fructobacillus fructosus]MCK8638763.1 Pr6Pr family membrane protein [Fructobacillus fructosus]